MPQRIEPFKKIVVALSGKPVNPQVIHQAVRLSTLLNAELHAVHMRFPHVGELTMMMEPLPLYTEDDLRAQFRERGYTELAETLPVQIVEGTHVAKLLGEVTKGADMIIMGHRHRNRILAALSAAPIQLQILDVVDCPVVVIPKSDSAKEENTV